MKMISEHSNSPGGNLLRGQVMRELGPLAAESRLARCGDNFRRRLDNRGPEDWDGRLMDCRPGPETICHRRDPLARPRCNAALARCRESSA